MKALRKLFILIIIISALTACENFLRDDVLLGRVNPNDPEYTGDDTSDDTSGDPAGVPASIYSGEIEIKIGSTTYDSSINHSFESTLVGETSTLSITINNLSTTEKLTLDTSNTALTGDSEFIIASPLPADGEIAAGGSYSLIIEFEPGSGDAYTGTLKITSSDEDESVFTVNLSGNGAYLGTRLSASDLSDGDTIISEDSYIIDEGTTITPAATITVNSGYTLTIYKGVTLDMSSNMIEIFGKLDVKGTASEPVTFTGSAWDGLFVNNEATIDHAYFKELGSVTGIRAGSNVFYSCSKLTLTNSRIHHSGNTEAITIAYVTSGAEFTIRNNIIVYTAGSSNSQEAFNVYSSVSNTISVDFSYNTVVSKYKDGYAITIADNNSSTYQFTRNLITGNNPGYTDIFNAGSAPNISLSSIVVDSYSGSVTYSNVDSQTNNMQWAIYDNRSTIFTDYVNNDFSMAHTDVYPASADVGGVADHTGCLSQVNPAGAYGDGGTPPAP